MMEDCKCDWPKFTGMMEEELCPVQGSKWTLDDMNLEATAIKNSMIKCMNECAQKSKTRPTESLETVLRVLL